MKIIGILKNHIEKVKQQKDAQASAHFAELELALEKEKRIKEQMKASPFIDALFMEFNQHHWILHRQGSNDTGHRRLCITNDTVEIKWSKWQTSSRIIGQDKWGIDIYQEEHIEEVFGHVIYSFTRSGYAPFADCDFDKKRALADIIVERMEELVPGTYSSYGSSFSDIYSEHRTYTLPSPTTTFF